ncbi:MAG: molybdopterin cofactor-binding domain-containing protein [Pseudomonadota bacterium]
MRHLSAHPGCDQASVGSEVMKRRAFLASAAGASAIAFLGGCGGVIPTIPSRPKAGAEDATSWIAWRDGRYVLSLPRAEIGQNISTGLKQIACAELNVAWDDVEVISTDTRTIAPFRATVGSESIQDFTLPRAQACAALREAVAEGRTGAIEVAERPREALRAFRPGALTTNITLVGVHEIFTGQPLFVADIRLPGMAYGRVLRGPVSPEIRSAPLARHLAAAEAEPGFIKLIEHGTVDMNNSTGLGIVAATPGALDRIEAALAV